MNNEKIPTIVNQFNSQQGQVYISHRPASPETEIYRKNFPAKSTRRGSISPGPRGSQSPTRSPRKSIKTSSPRRAQTGYSPTRSPKKGADLAYDVSTRTNSPIKRYTLPGMNKPMETQTVLYYDEEAEKQLIAKYEKMRADILRQIQLNQSNKAAALADVDRRIEALIKNYSEMTRQKVEQMREIHEFNERVTVIGLRKIEVNDVE